MGNGAITSSTVKNLVIDEAVVYFNYKLTGADAERVLGATRGGARFTVERTFREVEVDGSLGPVKGMKRIIGETARITCTLIEFSKQNLLDMLPGTSSADDPSSSPTHDKITSSGAILDADYIKNVAIVGKVSGSTSPIVLQISNALADGNFEASLEYGNEAGVEVVFTAHYDPSSLATVPYEIRYPKIV
jgi:hypothetical protein